MEINPFEEFKIEVAMKQDFSGSSEELEALRASVEKFAGELGLDLDFRSIYLSDNSKTGEDICNINIGSALNCYEAINGHCSIQKPIRDSTGAKTGNKQVCYGCAINNRLKLKYLYDIYNYIVFNTISLNSLFNQVKAYCVQNECNFVRFNETGSFYGVSSFNKALELSKMLIENNIILKAFSYTSNRKLFNQFKNNEYLVLSYSKGFKSFNDNFYINDDCKTIIVNSVSIAYYENNTSKAIKQVREALIPFLNDDRFVICRGNCSKCSYCKDTKDKRIVVFLRHGNGFNGHLEDYLTPDELFKLGQDRDKDNTMFLYDLMFKSNFS